MTAAAPLTASSGSSRRTILAPAAQRRREPLLRRLQFPRTGDVEREVEARRGVDPGRQHVVEVAGPGDLAAADRTHPLLESQDVGQHLAGMRLLGEAVDDRNGRVGRHFEHVVLAQNADDDRLDVARQHARGVGDGLAAAELHFRACQHDRLAAELAHGDIEGNARARGGPIEDHRERLAVERARAGAARP